MKTIKPTKSENNQGQITAMGAIKSARRTTGVSPMGSGYNAFVSSLADPEVSEKKPRRKFTAKYKLQILAEADSCKQPGQIGALLRHEGLYSSSLTLWRRQRENGIIKVMTPRKRGRKHSRYKSILCQEDTYLLELVRYIHLNPLRAKLIKDFDLLRKYPYSGHRTLMGKVKKEWQDIEAVLRLFDERIGVARRRKLNLSLSGVSQSVSRGEKIAEINGLKLLDINM